MLRRVIAVALVIAVVFGGAAAASTTTSTSPSTTPPPNTTTSAETYSIKGWVRADVDGHEKTAPTNDRGASVTISRPSEGDATIATSEVDDQSMYRFDGLVEGEYFLRATLPGFEDQVAYVYFPGEDGYHDFLFVNQTSEFIHFQFVDAETNNPLASKEISIHLPSHDQPHVTTLNEVGMTAIHRGRLFESATIEIAGYEPAQVGDHYGPQPVVVQVWPSSSRIELSILAIDQDRQPAAGLTVDVTGIYFRQRPMKGGSSYEYYGRMHHSYDLPFYQPDAPKSITLDDSGRGSFKTLPGMVNLWFHGAEFRDAWAEVDATSGEATTYEQVVHRLPPLDVRVIGVVVDDATGDPLGGISVSVSSHDWGTSEQITTADDGRFEMLQRAGYSVLRADQWREPCWGFDSYMDPESAKPIPPDYAPEPSYHYYNESEPSYGTTYTAQGTYTMTTMAYAEPVIIRGRPSHFECRAPEVPTHYARTMSLSLVGGETRELEVRLVEKLKPAATIQGWAVDVDHKSGIPQAGISFSNLETGASGYATADDDGSYKMNVDPGYYMVYAYAADYYGLETNVLVIPPPLAFGRVDPEPQRVDLFLHRNPNQPKNDYPTAYPMPMTMTMTTMAPGHYPEDMRYDGGSGLMVQRDGDQAYEGSGGSLGPYRAAEMEGDEASSLPSLGISLIALGVFLVLVIRRRN